MSDEPMFKKQKTSTNDWKEYKSFKSKYQVENFDNDFDFDDFGLSQQNAKKAG